MKLKPIYRRDAQAMNRSAGLPLVVMGFNAGLSLLVLLNLYMVSVDARYAGEIGYDGFLEGYYMLAGFELFLLWLITPGLTASAISGERERKTLELLFTTELSPFDIVLGKMLVALRLSGLLAASSLPVLATVFIYGGVTVGELAFLAVGAVLSVCFCASIGICASACLRSSTAATATSYVIVFLTAGGCACIYMKRAALGLGKWWFLLLALLLLSVSALALEIGIKRLKQTRKRR